MAAKERVRRTKNQVPTRLTSGRTDFLFKVDARTLVAKRFSELVSSHTADLGGEDACSEGQKAILRRACILIVALEQMESAFASTGSMSVTALDQHQRASNSLRRLLTSIGLDRRARDVTPPKLSDYINGQASVSTKRVVRQ